MFQDEMRLGLRGQVRSVWAPVGVKVVQSVQLIYKWCYLVLGVDPLSGELVWEWTDNMKTESLQPVINAWNLDGIVWDGASSHRSHCWQDTGLKAVRLPPYSPELNPAERVFQEIRRKVEGWTYLSLDEKKQAVEEFLRELEWDNERVQQLVGWHWIQHNLNTLPAEEPPAQQAA